MDSREPLAYNLHMRTRTIAIASVASLAVLASAAWLQKDNFTRYKDGADAKQAALEGKAAPKLVASEWVNSKPLRLDALKGKVVLLDFWAYW